MQTLLSIHFQYYHSPFHEFSDHTMQIHNCYSIWESSDNNLGGFVEMEWEMGVGMNLDLPSDTCTHTEIFRLVDCQTRNTNCVTRRFRISA